MGASHPGPPDHFPEDIFSDLEVVLTRIDSSDEEPVVQPITGRHVIRKVHEEQSRFSVLAHEPTASSAHVTIPCHHELPREVDVAVPTATAPKVPFLSGPGCRGPGALVVDMTEADSERIVNPMEGLVFDPDTDDEDENVVDALQEDLEPSVLPILRDSDLVPSDNEACALAFRCSSDLMICIPTLRGCVALTMRKVLELHQFRASAHRGGWF